MRSELNEIDLIDRYLFRQLTEEETRVFETGLLLKERIVYLGTAIEENVAFCGSMSTVLLTSGQKGQRYALPHATIHMHPTGGGAKGYTEDVRVACKESVIPMISLPSMRCRPRSLFRPREATAKASGSNSNRPEAWAYLAARSPSFIPLATDWMKSSPPSPSLVTEIRKRSATTTAISALFSFL